jgi:hypothetical protein
MTPPPKITLKEVAIMILTALVMSDAAVHVYQGVWVYWFPLVVTGVLIMLWLNAIRVERKAWRLYNERRNE